ncbi:hypothetical protein [Fodinicola feengrottensis]|uniref:hypothetical protein n=1 Tax=Fodinicola feengrottensis TaxID=435914 RepID=UPI0013D85785|nr:hypothetical protein [Fodinicola feengrottensis]
MPSSGTTTLNSAVSVGSNGSSLLCLPDKADLPLEYGMICASPVLDQNPAGRGYSPALIGVATGGTGGWRPGKLWHVDGPLFAVPINL